MGVRDALLLNTTGSNFEALQSGDTARIKGDFSVKNTSDTQIFGVDVSAATVNIAGNITSSMGISSSLSSTGSFGRVVASTFLGDGVAIRDTLVRSSGLVTASAQIAADISGAFDAGFFFGFQASSSISGGLGITGSFGRLQGVEFHGDGHNIKTTLPRSTGILTSSAQISADISGSFTSGFEFSNDISGSATSTGSFGRVVATTFHGDGGGLQSTLPRAAGTITSSAQLAADISGSFNKGFTFTTTSSLGHPTGSLISGQVGAWSVGGNLNTGRNNHNSCTGAGVAAANAVSLFGGKVPASPNYTGKTENYDGTSWSESGDLDEARADGASFGTQTAGVYAGGEQGGSAPNNGTTFTEEFNGSSWSEVTAYPQAMVYATGAGTQGAGLVAFGGQSPAPTPNGNRGGTYSVEYNGTNWVNASTAADFGPTHSSQIRHSMAGIQNAAITVGNGDSPPGGAPYMWCTVMNYDGAAWSIGTSTPNGTKWSSLAGTQNDVLSAGGYSSPQGPWNGSSTFAQRFNGTAWSDISSLINNQVAAGGAGLTSYQMTMYGGYTEGSPSWTGYVDDTQEYCEGISNLTVDRLKANHLTGDGSFIKGFFPNIVSGSAQLASNISGSFNKGFGHQNQISGSAISTGSFGRVDSDDFRGDGSLLTSILIPTGLVTGSTQLAAQISGAFTSGFEFGMTALEQITGSYVGVSGSAFAYAGNATTMSISSICGSDFEFRIADTINQIKGTSYGTGVWSAGPNRNDDQSAFAAVGTQNAYLSAGGYKAPKNGTEKYDGTAWSLSANMSIENCTAVGFGTQNAAAIAGGYGDYDGTELYNGATYSDAGNMGKQRRYGASAGTQNAGLVFSGTSPSPASSTDQADTETFDGNTWTEVNNMTVVRSLANSGGTQNSAIIAGGYCHGSPGALRSCSEIWNGTNWTAISDMIQGKATGAGIGTQNHFIVAGGNAPSIGSRTVNTEEWNGTSWSEVNNLGTARNGLGGAAGGLGSAGIAAGGQIGSPTATNTIELWNTTSTTTGSFGRVENATYFGDGSSIKSSLGGRTSTVLSGSKNIATQISGSFTSGFESSGNILDQKSHTAGVWSGGAPMVGTYYNGAGAGTQNAALHFGGRGTPGHTNADTTNTEEWNGTSWTEQNNMPESHRRMAGAGSQNSALSMGGYPGQTDVLYYNGTNWAEKADLPAAKQEGIGVGKDADALHIGGGNSHPSVSSTDVDKYSLAGNAWSEETSTPVAVGANSAAGTTEALILGRYHASEGSLTYNGSSWSEVASLIVNRGNGKGMFGTQNDAVNVGGCANSGNNRCCTEIWNGTSWSAGNAMTIGRGLDSGRAQGSPSSGNAGLAFSTGYSATIGGAGNGFTELYNGVEFSTATGSFGLLKPRAGGIDTKAFQVTSSLFKLPVFSDRELNYQAYESQLQTGSLSGSVDRVADVVVGQKLGEMWFDSDKNAVGYTYQSSSLISQSLSLGTFTMATGSGYYQTSSIGLFTQSFYSDTIVTCYLTGSQI